MPKKPEHTPSGPKEIKGNKTTIHPDEKPVSQYGASVVTSYENKGNSPPAMRDSDVASARNFVIDNKK